MRLTLELSQSPLFQLRPESLSVEERIRLTYQRAQAIGRTYGSHYSRLYFVRNLTP